ncbi:ribonuclease HII [Candidatus Kinetoplastidibacterium crithidiae]|uniref:Ribonuclease HII n=1 Tax=Candidatus Kinetoplastidibacterium crithidiae TCC036E TaxID=1208918 RepID=M1LU40_9PROT|nr:ribonuclease HII [Candidatus Kinetoplastibacterium crithidii]AFZ82727.1 ribonuclease HII [Candidatus Kinetoplastibacterium crithidii (ex Angomonas deanei ATCC 30255)]AGF47621.1 ribonuclease HII [Candidatus Kinetoplastibacterium crithidii TCC036E]
MSLDFTVFSAGIDESGRGSLAGPVYAAAVILDDKHPIRGLADSKLLNKNKREQLSVIIKEKSLSWAIGISSVEEIDSLNILQATLLAMRRAVLGLSRKPNIALVDGNVSPHLDCLVKTIVGGDRLVQSISAASILAKTERDAEMLKLHLEYPNYGFDQHKGYCTSKHLRLLRLYGPCVFHRRSFAPVREVINL